MKAIINARIYDYNKYIENGYIVFDKKIIAVGSMDQFIDKNYELIDANGKLILPNFVCAHSHIYSIFARGLSLPFNPNNFVDILEQMWWKIDSKITNDITHYSAVAACYEFLLNGVTTIFDHHASGEIIGSLETLKSVMSGIYGFKGLLCFETSDRYNVLDCVKENSTFYKNNKNNPSFRGLFGLHASMTLSNNTLKLIKNNLNDEPLHVHVGESIMDEEDSLNKYNVSIIKRFEKYGLLNDDSLIVHGVCLSDEELDILNKHNCYLVVNTTSNMNNAVGLPNVKNYLNHNIKVMVGNDGLNSNMASEYVNVYYTTHLLNRDPKQLNLNDVKAMINNAYEYASRRIDIKIGKLEKDFISDFMVVDYHSFTNVNKDNIFGHIFYGLFPSFKPEDVYVNGELKVKNYNVNDLNIINEFKKCNESSNKLWKLLSEEK